MVEWADRGLNALPEEHLLIQIEHIAATKRRLIFEPRGARYTKMLAKLKTARKSVGK